MMCMCCYYVLCMVHYYHYILLGLRHGTDDDVVQRGVDRVPLHNTCFLLLCLFVLSYGYFLFLCYFC